MINASRRALTRRTRVYIANAAVVVGVFVVLQAAIQLGLIDRYIQGLMVLSCINIILTLSLNIATGFLGELCLGHAGFMAVGAYTAALITLRSGLPVWPGFILGIVAGGLTAGIAGYLIGIPALRLRGDYLAIITLAFGEIISVLLRSLPFTGGALGLNGIRILTYFPVAWWTMSICLTVILTFMLSRHGRQIIAIREDDIAAEATGINTLRMKMTAFVASAFFAGIAGGLFAHYQGILAPEKFDYNYSIDIMVMVVFGGMGSVTGSIVSAIFLTILPEILRGFSQYRMLVYAVLLILLMLFRPEGLFGRKEVTWQVLGRHVDGMRRRIADWRSGRDGMLQTNIDGENIAGEGAPEQFGDPDLDARLDVRADPDRDVPRGHR